MSPEIPKKKLMLIHLVMLCFFLMSCAAGSSGFKNGYYTAEAAEFDDYGWKEYVTICVTEGRIVMVEYNAYNRSGFVKSWDMNYMRVMNAASGIYPNAYTRGYARQFLSFQDTKKVDRITGATISYHTFIQLADAALENARLGNSETKRVYFAGGFENTPLFH